MYIIAGSTGTIGSAIVRELVKNHEIFLIGRDKSKLKTQADKYSCKYEVIDLKNTPEPREFSKIIDQDVEITGLVNCIGSILIKPLHGTSLTNLTMLLQQTYSHHIFYLLVLLEE